MTPGAATPTPRPRPSRLQVLAAALAVAAAGAAALHAPAALRAPLGFALFGVIPGWLLSSSLLRRPSVTPEERAMAALALSAPVVIAARFAAFAAGVPGPVFVAAWAAVCAAWALVLRPPARGDAPPVAAAWVAAAALAALVALPALLNPAARVFGDAVFHAQVTEEIRLRGVPPEAPFFAGFPLEYWWHFHVWMSALTQAMGVSPYAAFPWVAASMAAALAFAACRAAALYWPGRPLYARLAPVVVPLGMNALGWVPLLKRVALPALRGGPGAAAWVHAQVGALLAHPAPNELCRALIHRSSYLACSLLYKYFCANAMNSGLTLVATLAVLVAVFVKDGGRGRLACVALASLSLAVLHPVVGVPACGALLAGLALAAAGSRNRGAALRCAAAVALGLALSVPVLRSMLDTGLRSGEGTRLHFMPWQLPPLAQAYLAVALPALWGWREALRRDRAVALVGGGFALACLAFALVADLPDVVEVYLVYTAYLSAALFAAAGVAEAARAVARRTGAPAAWLLVATVFLPGPLLLANGFARQDASVAGVGYPSTPDELAAYGYLRDHTPLDAVVVDSQIACCSAAAGYAWRREYYGGSYYPREMGYPPAETERRERAVVNLFFERGELAEETRAAMAAVRAPLYVVARRQAPPHALIFYRNWSRWGEEGRSTAGLPDAVARLDSLPGEFPAVCRTPGIVVYRYRAGAARQGLLPPPPGGAERPGGSRGPRSTP